MARISEEMVNEIRANADIVEIIREYVPLTQRGKNYFGVCPFHQDHSPSMSVSKEKQMFKCFSCGMAGNVFKFISEIENISYMEAIGKVGDRVGIHVSVGSTYQTIQKYEKEYEIMNLACIYFENNIHTEKGKKAKEYLKERGINESMSKEFSIGLSLDHNAMLEFFRKKKVSEKDLLDLGLIKEDEKLNFKDVFVNRILFPIHNAEGKVIGFTGRIYGEEKGPKYLNSKETVLFKKGSILFNYHRAKDAARKEKQIILVEGNMDAIRMYVSGIYHTVATMGTALTKEQIELLQKLRASVLLMFDNDDAGALATLKNGELLENAGFDVQVVRLHHEKDPDEYILKNGVDAMRENIKHPISFLEYKLQYLKQNKNLQDTNELAEYVKNVLKSLSNADAITKDITIRKLSTEYDLSYDVLKNELDHQTSILPKEIEERRPPKKPPNRYELSAKSILYYMMNDVKYIKMFQNKLGYFKEETYRGVASEIEYYYEKNKQICLADFLSYAETSPLKDKIYEIVSSIKEEELADTSMEEYMNNIKEDTWLDKISVLKKKMKDTIDMLEKENIASEVIEFTKKIQEIRKERSVKND